MTNTERIVALEQQLADTLKRLAAAESRLAWLETRAMPIPQTIPQPASPFNPWLTATPWTVGGIAPIFGLPPEICGKMANASYASASDLS